MIQVAFPKQRQHKKNKTSTTSTIACPSDEGCVSFYSYLGCVCGTMPTCVPTSVPGIGTSIFPYFVRAIVYMKEKPVPPPAALPQLWPTLCFCTYGLLLTLYTNT